MKLIRRIGLGLLGLAAIAPNAQFAKAETGISIQKQKEGIVKPVRSARKIIREDAGGLNVIGYNPGIPPPHLWRIPCKKGNS